MQTIYSPIPKQHFLQAVFDPVHARRLHGRQSAGKKEGGKE
jgi:hypothetical protein